MLPAFPLPSVVEACEIFLVMRCENGTSFRCGEKVEFVVLPADAQFRGQINQMARRAKLAGQPIVLYAVVKVYRYHAAALRA